jgi:tetratricopeptide (TPR) repeat protein
LSLVKWLLDARSGSASGTLTVWPPLQNAIRVTFKEGRVRHIAPDLEVLAGAGDDPGAAASALEVGRDMVADRMVALAELRDGEYTFVENQGTDAGTGLPLNVDPVAAVFRSFDNAQCHSEQATVLGQRWDERLQPGPTNAALIDGFRQAWPQSPVAGAIDRAQSITELVDGAPDALTLLARVYAAVATGVAQLVDLKAQADAQPAGIDDMQAQMDALGAGQGTPADSLPAGMNALPWDAEEDLVLASAPPPETPATPSAEPTVEELVAEAAEAADPWLGVSAYPDVAARVVRRDERIREGVAQERRTRSGVSQLIRPASADVGLNLDLVDDEITSIASLLTKPTPTPAAPSPPVGPAKAAAVIATPPPTPRPNLTVPPSDPAPAPNQSAPRFITTPAEAAAPAGPRVPTTPSEPPAAGPRVLTTPSDDPPPGPRVLTTPSDDTAAVPGVPTTSSADPTEGPRVLTAPAQMTLVPASPEVDEAGKGDADDPDEVSESDAELLVALNNWLQVVEPHLEAKQLYKALGVDPEADRDAILQKHRELVVRFHPDRFERFNLGPESEALVIVWGKLNKAIVTLTDPDERLEYDIYIDRKRRGLPTDPEVVLRAESTYMDGERLLRAGRYPEAEAKYDQAISLNKAEPEFHVARAWARIHNAIPPLRPGESDPGLPSVIVRDAARKTFDSALKEIPRLDRAHYYLGMLAKMDGNAREAKRQFNDAIFLNKQNVEAKREIRLLDMRGGTDGPSGDKGGLFGRFRKP